MSMGLNMMQSITSTDRARDYILANEKNSIRLLFPNLDFGYTYAKEDTTGEHLLRDYFDAGDRQLIWEKRAFAVG